MPAAQKIWQQIPFDHERLNLLARELDMPRAIAAALLVQGVKNRAQALRFLFPSLNDLPSPFLMKGMREAVSLVLTSLASQHPVIVYGDYDVDGVTGTALLYIFLKKIGFTECYMCQPDRFSDGYGLHVEAVERIVPKLILRKKPLIITVDCGISSIAQVKTLTDRGCKVIVSDHHQPPGTLPEADVIINPWQPGCNFPDKNLSGVGIAFYLAMGVRSKMREQGREVFNLKGFLDLVAIGTVADMVPITGVNRILVKAGLEVIRSSPSQGLREICNVSGVVPGVICTEDISFRLGPRLNSAGRMMGNAGLSLALLTAKGCIEARKYAGMIDQLNSNRKYITEEVFRQAKIQADESIIKGEPVLVLAHPGWHQGVLGIVAARIMDCYKLPTLILSLNDGVAKGSGRSLPGIDLHGLLNSKHELFTAFGGHPAAVGISLPSENIPALKEFLGCRLSDLKTDGGFMESRIDILWQESGDFFGTDFLAWYERMEPFGVGNPEPVFAARVNVFDCREVGAGHLRFAIKTNGAILDGIGFGQAGNEALRCGDEAVTLAFRFRRNNFSGKSKWQVEALDALM